MRAINKNVLIQKINSIPSQYISASMFIYWLSMYGQCVNINDEYSGDKEGEDNTK